MLFIAAGFLIVMWNAAPPLRRRERPPSEALAVAPFSLLTGTAGGRTLVAVGLCFLKAGAFVFGSGLAIVPFLREGVVNQHRWLSDRQFLDAVAIGLITPGPVVITAAFIAYLVGGFTGAGTTTVAISTPIYLGEVIPGRWFIRHRESAEIRAFVRVRPLPPLARSPAPPSCWPGKR